MNAVMFRSTRARMCVRTTCIRCSSRHVHTYFPCLIGATDCGKETYLKASDHVRCRHCGYRILYKARAEDAAREYTAR